MENLAYEEIGQAALSQAEGASAELLVFAEIEPGVTSIEIFYVDDSGHVIFKIASAALREKIVEFWGRWRSLPGNAEWRCMKYVVKNGKFAMDFTYPDQIDDDEDPIDRRTRVAESVFGDSPIDYSDPGW